MSSDARFVLYKDTAGKYRWRLKAPNGDIIADSGQGYVTKDDAKNGVALVRSYAPAAELVDIS